MVDRRLAADRGVDLGQERRRQLRTGDAPLVAGGREPGHVANHSAAEGKDRPVPMDATLDERIEHRRERGKRLVLLAVGQDALD